MSPQDPRMDALIDWIRSTTENIGLNIVVPVSGGSDSALCFWLCTRALRRNPESVVAVYVGGELRCRDWFTSLGTVRLLPQPDSTVDPEIARWGLMLREAHAVHGWLAGSRNRTEDVLGTYSLASRIVTYLPLVRLWKSEVMDLAKQVGVPEPILESSRRADLACDRTQQMADIPFEHVDRFLQVQIGNRDELDLKDLAPEHLAYLDGVYRRNRFKADLPRRPPF
jgi:NAD+ synthase